MDCASGQAAFWRCLEYAPMHRFLFILLMSIGLKQLNALLAILLMELALLFML